MVERLVEGSWFERVLACVYGPESVTGKRGYEGKAVAVMDRVEDRLRLSLKQG